MYWIKDGDKKVLGVLRILSADVRYCTGIYQTSKNTSPGLSA